MADDELPKVGVWRAIAALGHYRFVDAVWPEVVFGLVLGVGGAIAAIDVTEPHAREAAAAQALALGGVLLAVTFAALALVVAIPSGEYLRALGETGDKGMQEFLDPFLIAVGAQILLVLLSIGYRIFCSHLSPWIEHTAFGAIGFLLVFALLDVAGLARQLVFHGIARSRDAVLAAREREEATGQVTRLHEGRRSSD